MSAIDFPDNPADGDEFTAPGGITWVFEDPLWVLLATGGGGGSDGFTFIQDTVPTATAAGQTWFDTSTSTAFVWVVDVDSAQWVQYAPGSGGGGGGGGGSADVGSIIAWSGDTIPGHLLVCDGSAVPAGSQYDALRAIVGTNVPDLRDRFLLGASGTNALRSTGGAATHTLTEAEMPAHLHAQQQASVATGGALLVGNTASGSGAGLNGNTLPTGGGGPHNNMPPFYVVRFVIVAIASGGGGGAGSDGFTFVQDTVPSATAAGQTWLDTRTGDALAWFVDADSSQWVQFAPGDGGDNDPVAVSCRLRHNVAQTPGAGSILSFNEVESDPLGMRTSDTTITVSVSGLYLIGYSLSLAPGSPTGLLTGFCRIDNVNLWGWSSAWGDVGGAPLSGSTVVAINAGQTVTCHSDIPAGRSIQGANSSGGLARFGITRLGALP